MSDVRVLAGVIMDDSTCLSLSELCYSCDVSAEFVIELVDEGVIIPQGQDPVSWYFSGEQVRRVQTALRLAEDLRVNMPGVALALELLDELEQLRLLRQRRYWLERDGKEPV